MKKDKKLYKFQEKGVEFLEQKNGRALIADEMGLGKTIQTIAYVKQHPELFPVVVVCPATVKFVWKNEFKIWFKECRVKVIEGRRSEKIEKDSDVVIINYDILARKIKKKPKLVGHLNRIVELKPKLIVIDEIHYIKTYLAVRSRAVRYICRKMKHIIGLSGTPIENSPIEFYNIIKILSPKLFLNKMNYGYDFCDLKHNGFAWDYSGASNTDRLNRILKKNFMIRRLKKDVLKELPAKTRSVIPLEIDNKREYKHAVADIIDWIDKNEGSVAAVKAGRALGLVKLTKLKHLAAQGKMNGVFEWIDDFLMSGEKLVVFGIHKDIMSKIIKRYKYKCVDFVGSTSKRHREIAVNVFQNNKNVKLFAGNLFSAGIGITLHAARSVLMVEYALVPGKHIQAEDRVHRIGQKDGVNIYYTLARNTIEEDIVEILQHKFDVLEQVLDGKSVDDKKGNLFKQLLKRLKKGNSYV